MEKWKDSQLGNRQIVWSTKAVTFACCRFACRLPANDSLKLAMKMDAADRNPREHLCN